LVEVQPGDRRGHVSYERCGAVFAEHHRRMSAADWVVLGVLPIDSTAWRCAA
jgi:hypothetical protein